MKSSAKTINIPKTLVDVLRAAATESLPQKVPEIKWYLIAGFFSPGPEKSCPGGRIFSFPNKKSGPRQKEILPRVDPWSTPLSSPQSSPQSGPQPTSQAGPQSI